MGLDFDNSNVCWSYSGFNAFRNELCEEADLGKLDDYQGFGGKKKWVKVKDGIKYFLNHSDCDGHLTVAKMKKIIPRIKALASKWDESNYNKARALTLASDMEGCVERNVVMKFM